MECVGARNLVAMAFSLSPSSRLQLRKKKLWRRRASSYGHVVRSRSHSLKVEAKAGAGSESCVVAKADFADEEDFVKAGGSELVFVQMQQKKSMEMQSKLADKLPPISIGDDTLDLVVIGCGPAGLALAAESGKLGLKVGLIGPDLPFTNNYGVWEDEFKDPTKKQNFLSFAYNKIDPTTSEVKLQAVKDNLAKLFAEYVKEGTNSDAMHPQQLQSSSGGVLNMANSVYICEEFEEHESQSANNIGISELDAYLSEPRLPPCDGFNILAYWKERSRRCPDLANMAFDILSIPITTVASESAFSIGSRVFNKYRSSLKDDTVQVLLCTRSWLHGFVAYDNEEGDDDAESNTLEDVQLSQEGSNSHEP